MPGRPKLPGFRPYDKAFAAAFEQAAAALRAADLDAVARRTGADLRGSILSITYFGARCDIGLPEVAFEPAGTPLRDRILILHYLTSEGGNPQSASYASFRSLPDGMFYDGPFRKRATQRILDEFRGNPGAMIDAAESIGGQRWNLGDISVRLQVFPVIDVVVAIYNTDDEFPPDANMLFSDNIGGYLSLEDVAILGGEVATRLCGAAPMRSMG